MAVGGLQRRKTVQEIVLERKLISEDKVKAAEEKAKQTNKSFQQALLAMNLVTKGQLLKTLSEAWRVKAVDLSQMQIDKEVLGLVPESVARRHTIVPFAKEEGILFVAMADPQDFFACEDIHLRTGLEVKPFLAMPEEIYEALGAGGEGEVALDQLAERTSEKLAEALSPETEGLELAKNALAAADITDIDPLAPEVEKFANAVILEALSMKASDIHIEPFEELESKDSKVMIRYRVDGMLREGKMRIPWAYRNAIIAKIKIMTHSMNITEKRIPQSGRIQILVRGNPIEFRVEIIPSVFGEACVMRILDRAAVQVEIEKMGFLPDTQEKFLGLLKGIGGKRNFGLILCCGPTGSGKSTTLYAALNYINRPDIKILTAENPVEYNLDGIIQVPINPDIKLGENKKFNFALAIRSFVRLDPDVIMVGEIRDEETAAIAMEAAMTGHLVFSTIHTNDAPSSISRLVEMGMPSYLVASTIKAVLGQRLSRRLCPQCKVSREMKPDEIEVFKTNKVELPKDKKLFYKGNGCDNCKGIGFRGRVGMHELMVMTNRLRATCIKDVSADGLRKVAVDEGMRMLIQDGLEKAKTGITTVREALGGSSASE